MISTDIGVWIGVILTICAWSFLIKDQDLYRLAEYTFVPVASGYTVVQAIKIIMSTGTTPLLGGDISLLIPLILGVMLYFNYSSKYRWVSNWSMAILVGVGIGVSIRGTVKANFVDQIVNTMIPLAASTPLQSFTNIVIVVFVVTILSYFLYTIEPKGPQGKIMGWAAPIARYMMMMGFGVSYGNMIANRLSILLGRVQYILFTALGLS